MKRHASLLSLLLFLAVPMPAIAQEVTPDEEADILEALEPPAEAPAAAPRFFQSMNPDISFILDANLAGFSSEPQQLGAHDPNKTGFNFQQLELSLGSVVDPYWRLDGNLVFTPFGVEIEEAYATSLALPANLQVRAGQFLTRFGRINATHPHSWDFVDQTMVIGKFFGGEGNFGLGTEASWLAPLPWYVELSGSVTDAAGGSTARSFFGTTDLGVLSPADFQSTLAVKQFFPFGSDWSLGWGLSGAFGPNPTGAANRSEIYGTDLYLKYRPLQGDGYTTVSLTTEAMTRRRQIPGATLVDHGGYLTAFWRFDQRWTTAARYELVTGTANDYLDPTWTGDRQRVSTSLTYQQTEFSRLRLQGYADTFAWRDPVYAVILAFEVLVGAHGAHKF